MPSQCAMGDLLFTAVPTSYGNYLGQINSWKQEWDVGSVVSWWRDSSLCCETHQKSLPCRQKVPDMSVPSLSQRIPVSRFCFSHSPQLHLVPGHRVEMWQQSRRAAGSRSFFQPAPGAVCRRMVSFLGAFECWGGQLAMTREWLAHPCGSWLFLPSTK